MKNMKHAPRAPRGKAFRNGAYASLLTALAVAAVILVNLVVGALPAKYTQFDLSETGLYTLTDTSKQILAALEQDVQVYYLAQTGSEDAIITKLLDHYADESGHFHWEQKDPALYPTFAAQYNAQGASDGSLIFESGSRTKVVDASELYLYDYSSYYTTGSYSVSFDGENQMTSAVQYVTAAQLPTVYQLTGHGEAELSGSLQSALGLQNIQLSTLNLLSGEIPEDAAALVLYGPSSDFAAEDIDRLRAYLDGGGSLLVCTDPATSTPNLNALLAEYGLSSVEGLVIEGDANYHQRGYDYYLLPTVNTHEATSGLGQGLYVLAPWAQGLQTAEELPEGVSVNPLLTTSNQAYSKLAGYDMSTTAREEGDLDGPFTLAAAATKETDAGTAKLIWLACPILLSEQANTASAGANGQFALGCVTWLAGQDAATLIAAKSMMIEGLSLTASQANFWAVLFTLVLPLALLAAGITVTLKRRRR